MVLIFCTVLFRFKVYDLVDQALFRLYLSFEACFEAGKNCSQTVEVMNSVELPKQDCIWSTGYRVSGIIMK